MPHRTFNELADEIDELLEIAEKYTDLPPGAGRNLLHMCYFGLSKLHLELEAGRRNRDKVAASKARRKLGEYRGQLFTPELPFNE